MPEIFPMKILNTVGSGVVKSFHSKILEEKYSCKKIWKMSVITIRIIGIWEDSKIKSKQMLTFQKKVVAMLAWINQVYHIKIEASNASR